MLDRVLDKLRRIYAEEGWKRVEGSPYEAYRLELFLERRPLLFPSVAVERYAMNVVDFPHMVDAPTVEGLERSLDVVWDAVMGMGLGSSSHYMSYVRLVAISGIVDVAVERLATRFRRIRGMKMGFHGLLRQYLVVLDVGRRKVYTHRDLKKQVGLFEEALEEP